MNEHVGKPVSNLQRANWFALINLIGEIIAEAGEVPTTLWPGASVRTDPQRQASTIHYRLYVPDLPAGRRNCPAWL